MKYKIKGFLLYVKNKIKNLIFLIKNPSYIFRNNDLTRIGSYPYISGDTFISISEHKCAISSELISKLKA